MKPAQELSASWEDTMQIEFKYQPMPVHRPFHSDTAYERALFGAFGSGKTYAICAEAIAWALEQPGIRGLIARKTVPELRDTTEAVFFDILPYDLYQQCEIKRSGGHVERVIFPNGSEILFRSLDDWNKHRSLNVGFIAYDEANEIDEETYLGMASRVRQRDPTAMAQAQGVQEVTRRGIWLATNPSGHDWLWKRFVSEDRSPRTSYHKSTSFDNPYLPPEYLESLLQYPKPWIERYVMCSFDDFAGQIYTEWSYDTHVVPMPELRGQEVFWMGMDPGTRSPTAGLWVVVDSDKQRLIATDEYQFNDRQAVQHAAEWRKIEARRNMHVRARIADPNVNTRDRGTNMALSDQYGRLGFHFTNGPRHHKDRIPMLGQMIVMGRFVVTENCMQTFDQIKNYRWEDVTPAMRAKGVDPKETPHKANDHLVDCAQYVCSRYVAPDPFRPPPQNEDFSSRAHRMIRKNLAEKRLQVPYHDLGGIV